MKRRLLDWICCPVCRGHLSLDVWLDTEASVEEGVLTCAGCAREYPVIAGIPRLLPDELLHVLGEFHRTFLQRHAARLTRLLARLDHGTSLGWWDSEARTVKSYSYQWRKFSEMFSQWEELFRWTIAPIEPSFFPGRVGLDAGCGYGRSISYAASYGAEMIGLDLSEAVEAARDNTRHLPNVHLIQGDIFHPPVREGVLDFVYSIGVLQHLPDPRRGFLTLRSLLKPAAPMFVWVYARGRGRQIALWTVARTVSTRLPLDVLDRICLVVAALHWALWIAPYRFLARFRMTRGLARRLPFTLYARYPFRVLHADWMDGFSVPLVNYYKADEIAHWFRDAGLERVTIAPDWGGRALGWAPAGVPQDTVR
jgi:uncharacterized protein YbaR (Trm112 family)/SAM-dependent methyltransferase